METSAPEMGRHGDLRWGGGGGAGVEGGQEERQEEKTAGSRACSVDWKSYQ